MCIKQTITHVSSYKNGAQGSDEINLFGLGRPEEAPAEEVLGAPL